VFTARYGLNLLKNRYVSSLNVKDSSGITALRSCQQDVFLQSWTERVDPNGTSADLCSGHRRKKLLRGVADVN